MDYILLLIEIVVVVAVICTAREIGRHRRHKLPESVMPLPPLGLHSNDMVHPSTILTHHVKRISMRECENLVHNFDNVVFIALRKGSARAPLPFPVKHAVSIAPGELDDVLKLIPDCYVVLCGEVDLCSSTLWALDEFARSRPIYVLGSAAVGNLPSSCERMASK